MKVAFITRSTLDKAPGGDTIQIKQTAKQLRNLGVQVDILPTTLKIDYSLYDLLHFFNIARPADILHHIYKSKKPFVLSPVFIDYGEYDRYHRKGITGIIFRMFSPAANEYFKTIGRWLLQKDSLRSKSFLFKGQTRSIKEVMEKATTAARKANPSISISCCGGQMRDLDSLAFCAKALALDEVAVPNDAFHLVGRKLQLAQRLMREKAVEVEGVAGKAGGLVANSAAEGFRGR